MTGCRHNAKNTLVKNYLYLAEKNGAAVLPLTTVTRVRRARRAAGTTCTSATPRPSCRRASATRVLTADQVVLAASALGTQRLLHRMKAEGHLPGLSDRLGELARTNSESILGAIAPDTSVDYTPGRRDHLVLPPRRAHPHRAGPLRQGQQRDVAAADRAHRRRRPARPRWRTWLRELWRQKRRVLDLYDLRHWSERTVIALVMQSRDNSITTFLQDATGSGRWVLTSRQGHGEPNPTWIPAANEAARRMAEVMGGTAGGTIGEPFNGRSPPTSSAAARSAPRRRPAWSTPTSGSTATPACTSSTGRRSRPTSA